MIAYEGCQKVLENKILTKSWDVFSIGSGVKNGSWKIEGAQLNLLNLTYSKVSGTIFFGLTEKLGIPQGGSHRIPNYHKIPI